MSHINNKKNRNIIPYFSLTNRNKELNLNLYNKNFFNNDNTKNAEIKFNKTSNYIKNDEFNKNKINKIKKIPSKKRGTFRSKSALNNYITNSNNSKEDDPGNFCTIHPEQRISHFV